MSQKTLVLIAASLTAFVLVVVGGVTARVASASAAAPAAAETQAQFAVREAYYRDLISQANQRLEEAYHQLGLSGSGAQVPAQSAAPAAPSYDISPDQAASIAMAAAPGAALLHAPELVDYQGSVAYEVRTSRGLMYVDATSGRLLYNGAAAAVVHVSSSSGEHEDGESESGDD